MLGNMDNMYRLIYRASMAEATALKFATPTRSVSEGSCAYRQRGIPRERFGLVSQRLRTLI